ncbi:TetR/AcrR family transcriptional regulator [Streptacidiphilus neutrinimicus]|uniref:TetR/AcrR family transcriptional regulator n=1 Tax=Streptacidiphilus neutrinimicus TaxID=105420 RepID=UPI000ACDD4EF|nr:TetR/AcrR family transcriptional regulator [Streptacidiphilus neutrinimicus]
MQRRSQERFDRILDATARLLDEVGYTALTTKEVARRAEVPIGTLYQFFPGVDGLLGALAERNLEHFMDRLTRRMEAERPSDIATMVDLAVEEYVAMHRAVPGFGVVDFGAVGREDAQSVHLLDSVLENNAAVADRLWALLGDLIGGEDRAAARISLQVALECADAVLRLAFRQDTEGDPVLIAECKKLLRGYLTAPD